MSDVELLLIEPRRMLARAITATLLIACLSSASTAADPASRSRSPAAPEQDYQRKLALPTTCGNQPYLASIAPDYREACDRTAKALQLAIRKSGKNCDHVSLAAPAIQGTPVSEALCVVRGGDVVFGLTTNTVNYMVTPRGVARLPADARESRKLVGLAVELAISRGESTN
jgi:hypothetical protein